MANVLNRTTKEFQLSVNTPDFDPAQWIINPDLSAVLGFDPQYWIITGDVVTLAGPAARQVVDDNAFIAIINQQLITSDLFGDGADGAVTISANTPLTGDLYPTILVVNAGVTLSWKGFNIVAQFGIINNGTIEFNGGNAAAGVAGLGAPTGTRGGGGNGALGTNTAGTNAASLLAALSPGFGGGGGNGGAGTAGAGGQGGNTRIGAASSRTRPRRMVSVLAGGEFDAGTGFVQYQGAAGGGAGSGDAVNPGGSGGGGAGFACLAAPLIFNGPTGIVSARGGNGFAPTAGNCGGGGGGGGGDLALIRSRSRNRGTIDVTGGLGGAGIGTGVAGQPGTNGRTVSIMVTQTG